MTLGHDIHRKVDMDKTVNLMDVLTELGIAANAAEGLFAHGSVSLDGRTLGAQDRVFPLREVRGRVLKAGRMETRIFGGRAVLDNEQLSL